MISSICHIRIKKFTQSHNKTNQFFTMEKIDPFLYINKQMNDFLIKQRKD